MDRSSFLYDVSPGLIDRLCKIIDSGDDQFGWRGLAARIVPSWLDVRHAERLEAAGRSPARELLWSWAQQQKTVADLVQVLEAMGHHWALRLLDQATSSTSANNLAEPEGHSSTQGRCEESCHQEESPHREGLLSSVSKVSYRDVVEGTRRFHCDMKISEGRLSDTYKGTSGNKTFTVKLFKWGNDRSWKERWDLFTREREVRPSFQHPNILDGLCCFSEEGNYGLVYPYLPYGSLQSRLHHQGAAHPLSWQQRLAIIQGTAQALHHLHAGLQSGPVICGNITSGNVLLDGDGPQPRLSNVGLAGLHSPPSCRKSCTVTSATGIQDNMGYLPPEVARGGELSLSLDVYSFGMVVMETITGRQVVEDTPKRSLLRDVLSAELEDGGSVDSCLRFLDRAAGSWPRPVALGLLRLALLCTAVRHRNRPTMETVLRELSQPLPLPSSLSHNNQPHDLHNRDRPSEDLDLLMTSYPPSPLPPPSLTTPPLLPSPSPAGHSPPSNLERQHGEYASATSAGPEWTKPLPCERSQSEVTFSSCEEEEEHGAEAGDPATRPPRRLTEGEAGVAVAVALEGMDLYNSWPVQCSCQAGSLELGCEDCRANGFTLEEYPPHFSGGVSDKSWNIVENPAKQTLKAKLELYHEGVLRTEDLLSLSFPARSFL
ncbi:hypothetical protein NHX12_020830 [Muraenolepis orangiensis]|uniref:Protein kinase domain-containing protein n=1 Tax=Muraenolepis orangiensis TaxID=630683 RepID=A0A9Q0ESP7_9TELE|nr:hypothetical protein NHX12_020830 [Muraenolepis orangiensis]